MKDFIMWFYGVDAAQAAAREPVAVVVVCTAMYTIFEVMERRKRKKFAEDIRHYIQNHKGEWTGDNQDMR